MKNIHILWTICFILITLCTISFKSEATEIYVGPNSQTRKRDGSITAPFETLEGALRQVREWRRLQDPKVAQGVQILLQDGVYRPAQTILLRPEDSGTEKSPTLIKGIGKEVILSGGVPVSGWKKAEKNIYVADAPRVGGKFFPFRQMWVGDQKAIRAESHHDYELPRILNWNFEQQTAIIPNVFKNFQFEEGMEFFIHQWWAVAQLRIKDAKVTKDSIVLAFHEPESKLQSEHPWPKPWLSEEYGNSAFRLVNAMQFLDQPGEWFLDEDTHKIYYYKRAEEDLNQVEAVVPYLETILQFAGTLEQPVSHISLEGIRFQHTSWLRPHTHGHVTLQAGMYFIDAYKLQTPGTPDKKGLENQAWVGRPKAAVALKNTAHTTFIGCHFQHLAATGIDYEEGNFEDHLLGNVLQDIGGNAVLLGKFSDEQFEAHLPYTPKDERMLTDGVIVRNNIINNATNEDWGAVGIGAGFVRNIDISNNDLSDLSYTGISLGWGWTPTVNSMKNNSVRRNRISRYGKFMYDVAGIYTLSAQPGTKIQENRIDSIYVSPYAHIPDHWFYLYTDEGSAYMNVSDNWFPEYKILQNANGPSVEWKNNGPDVSPEKMANAGLEASYRHLLQYKKEVAALAKFNVYVPFTKPVFVQVYDPNNQISSDELARFVTGQGGDASQIYHWKDYSLIKTDDGVGKKIASAWVANYPKIEFKVFNDLFYTFDRTRCGDAGEEKDVDYVLLTTKLVDDEKKQQMYFDYHDKQFEQWPEVADGFCNAGFEEVLLYRKDNQLMLYISFPKGSRFEDIDPLTIKDNPKVVEWNKLMGGFQEGIKGTAADETWVFYKK